MLQAYAQEVPAEQPAAPAPLLQSATPLDTAAAAQAEPGPVDAAAEDQDGGVEVSGALIDTSSSDCLALEQLDHMIKQNENVVLAQGAAAEAANDEAAAEALRLELISWQEVHKAIRKLTCAKLQEEL